MAAAHPRRRCPHGGCDGEITLASLDDVGAYLWRCSKGHHGPRLDGSISYAEG